MSFYHIWTIGCQMNVADSEQLSDRLQRLGYQNTEDIEMADIVVINSCVVRQSAENRVLSKVDSLKKLKKPNVLRVLMGCMVNSRVDELRHRFPHIDLFLKPRAFDDLLQVAKERAIITRKDVMTINISSPCAFIPIIHGCNNFCSYCIVPYRRGRERSRPLEEILDEVKDLTANGLKEVTLLGQNVDSYGQDLIDTPDLSELLVRLSKVENLLRIRFLTSHPKDMGEKLITTVANLDNVCKSINLPVQSGDDKILEIMRRGYTAQQYRQLVAKIRDTITDVSLSTDIIVGFPGESAEQFDRTYTLLKDLRFDTVHVASYSPRPGTIAARKLKDDIPSQVKKERLKIIEGLQAKVADEINARLLDCTVEVLVEGKKKEKWYGRTRTNKLVFFTSDAELLGQLVEVKIIKTGPWSLQGIA